MVFEGQGALAPHRIIEQNEVNDISGTNGIDWIEAYAGGSETGGILDCLNAIRGLGGNDRIISIVYPTGDKSGTNLVWGGPGNDRCDFRTSGYGEMYSAGYGGRGNDILTLYQNGEAGTGTNGGHFDGGLGNDRISLRLESIGSYDVDTGEPLGASYDNTFLRALGGQGNDRLATLIGCYIGDIPVRNVLDGGFGNDVMSAITYAPSEDTIQLLHGQFGNDVLRGEITDGGAGYSMMFGGPGNDRLQVIGGEGNVVEGGRGSDVLIGGIGADEFRFDPSRSVGTVDTIIGFDRAEDSINIRNLSDGIILEVLDDGADVHVFLFNDNKVVFVGMGTGEVDSVYQLVDSPEQISGWVD